MLIIIIIFIIITVFAVLSKNITILHDHYLQLRSYNINKNREATSLRMTHYYISNNIRPELIRSALQFYLFSEL